ncbi:type IV secretory system conjugative DNA transfer family protein [Bacillus mycoides]|uniref:VirD4-like conjugal transfer protein, CD1115 family n=1 Tax=Bacillus mycoides TaxID=1405 RepID=UPI002E0113B3|nr:type IV secretory system conjugative DNA transfer family protein [Bacillus mycoides]MEC5240634.1 type IV secretory system conjugative DNA transfer family protein [Bacillus mycoides]
MARHFVVILLIGFLLLLVDSCLAVIFALVPTTIHDPQNWLTHLTELIQDPINLVQIAWQQMPFKASQGFVFLLGIYIFFKARSEGDGEYKISKNKSYGSANWATTKQIFNVRYFSRKMKKNIFMNDLNRSFELKKQVDEHENLVRQGEVEPDMKIVEKIKEKALEFQETEKFLSKRIQEEALEVPEEERKDFLTRQFKNLPKRYLYYQKNGKPNRIPLCEIEEETLESYIPMSPEYVREYSNMIFEEFTDRMGNVIAHFEDSPVIQHRNSKLGNSNVFVIGGSGSYKTQSVVYTNVIHETQASMFVADVKGEIFENTSVIKEKQGYEVKVINFIDMFLSNCYNPLDYVRKETDATVVANKIVESRNTGEKKDIWYLSQVALLRSLILYVVNDLHPLKRNVEGIIEVLRKFDSKIAEGEDEAELDRLFLSLPYDHPARVSYEMGYKKSEDKVRSGIIITLLTTLADFTSEAVRRFTRRSDFFLGDLGRKKTILYLILDPLDSTWSGLINLFISQLHSELFRVGDENGSKLYIPFKEVLDEAANLGKLPNFVNYLSLCRGYGISAILIVQNLSQFEELYGKNGLYSILGVCSTKVILKAAEYETAEYISKTLGEATVENESRSTNTGNHGTTSSVSVQNVKRRLIDPNEIKGLEENQVLVSTDNTPSFKGTKAFQFELYKDKEGEIIKGKRYFRKRELFPVKQDFESKATLEAKIREFEELQAKKEADLQHEDEQVLEESKQQEIETEEKVTKEQQQLAVVEKARALIPKMAKEVEKAEKKKVSDIEISEEKEMKQLPPEKKKQAEIKEIQASIGNKLDDILKKAAVGETAATSNIEVVKKDTEAEEYGDEELEDITEFEEEMNALTFED